MQELKHSVTKNDKIFLGDQVHQYGAEAQCFRDLLCFRHSLMMEAEKVSETLDFCDELM
jgi:hypothetical protein